MAKMRVHELAKELNIKSQDVIDTLNGTQFAVKNVQSGLEDEAQQIVRKKYAKTEVKKDAPKKEEPKKDEAKAADRPKKKASITAVFNAQYSKQGRKTNGGNGSGNIRQCLDVYFRWRGLTHLRRQLRYRRKIGRCHELSPNEVLG